MCGVRDAKNNEASRLRTPPRCEAAGPGGTAAVDADKRTHRHSAHRPPLVSLHELLPGVDSRNGLKGLGLNSAVMVLGRFSYLPRNDIELTVSLIAAYSSSHLHSSRDLSKGEPVLQISLVLPNHSYFRLVAVLVFSLIGWWQIQPATPAVYECKARNGSIVLTDKPKRFQGCVLIETFTPSPKINGAQPLTPMRSQAEEEPNPAMPFSPPPPLPPHPPFLEGTQDSSSAGQPSASSDHDSAPCPPGINPLNPLSRERCTSTPSETPPAAHDP
jgi:hypothetical protein